MQPLALSVSLCVIVLLAGCATYHARPLPQKPDLASAPALDVSVGKLAVPDFRPNPFNADNGLDKTEVVTLAVLNNPDLKARRKQAGVAEAQLLQSGLLPNPQISASFMHPTGGPPPLFNGYSLGLSESIRALILHARKTAQARSQARKVNLDILWQEWQVAEKARQLYIALYADRRLAAVLQKRVDLYQRQQKRDQRALQAGNVTRAAISADLIGLVNANTAERTLERNRNKTWHQFDQLLGLKPDVHPKLAPRIAIPQLGKRAYTKAVANLARRRPDLLALKAGYKSQEASVRQAILGQFPNLSVGVTKASDTSQVRTIGPQISLSLPLFNHNQGQIAVARATRAQLRQAYQARLDQAVNQADQLRNATRIMQRQLDNLHKRLPELEQTTDAAQKSFAGGNMTAGTFINLRSSYFSTRLQAIHLKASLLQARAALQIVLGMTLGPATRQGNGGGA